MEMAERDFSKPAWELGSSTVHPELRQLSDDKRFFLLTDLFPDLNGYYVSAERASESRDVAIISIVLRRYVIHAGELPVSIDALVLTYLREIPPNRFDGQPYLSRLVVYSVGHNGQDDQAETSYPPPNILYDTMWSGFFDDSASLSDRESIYAMWKRKLDATLLGSGDIVHHREPAPHLGLNPRDDE